MHLGLADVPRTWLLFLSPYHHFLGANVSKVTDLQAIRNCIKAAKLPDDVRTTAYWYLDKLPDLYQKLEMTCESRFLDDIIRHVKCMLKTLKAPSSIATVSEKFRSMHERHGIPSLGIKSPATAAAKPVRS